MCGIAGLFTAGISAERVETDVRKMISELHHRGPDGGDTWRSESCNLVLGHRRLAIQDLSEFGKQPMHSASDRYCVVFNGEIYNFQEIAAELRQMGQSFSGHSDTEVLLAAIEVWGLEKAIQRFVGMFAFALFDKAEKVLHLCRDRLGEKPLYYGWLGGAFYFASELKAIDIVARAQLQINTDGLSDYLKNGYISAPDSIYKNIYKLVPGTVLAVSLQDDAASLNFSPWPETAPSSPKTYWSVQRSAEQGMANLISSESEAVDSLDAILRRTVKRQMIADVKVGTFLSGGIDSTVVSAIAQHESSENVRTYTIGFSEKEYDESAYAERIARHLDTEHLTMTVTPEDVLNVVPDMPAIFDEPFADSSQIPSYLVSRLAAEHVTVCLSGDGGDEMFAGYNRYLWTQSLWSKLSSIPFPVRLAVGKILALPAPAIWDSLYGGVTRFKSNEYARQKLIGLKIQKLSGILQKRDIYQAYDFLMSYWQDPGLIMSGESTRRIYGDGMHLSCSESFIDQAMYMDQSIYLPGDNLAKTDRASMAVSLETRLPLLSHEVIDFAWRIPVGMKVKNDVSKWALREVLYKYVPQEMIDRPKMGFSVPVAKWLRHDLKDWAGDMFSSIEAGSEFLRKETIQKTWLEHTSGKNDHSHRLWTVLMFLAWMQQRS